MSESNKTPLIVGLGLGVVAIGAVVALVATRKPATKTEAPIAQTSETEATGIGVEGVPDAPAEPMKLDPGSEPLTPAIYLDIRDPSAILAASKANPWLTEAMQGPLGRGFVGAWAGFFGSRGEDLAAGFSETVAEHLLGKLASGPVRVAWLGTESVAGTPALIVPQLSDSGRAAMAALDKVARRGLFQPEACPGEGEGIVEIKRWLVAERAVYSAEHQGRFVLARNPKTALHAACLPVEVSLADGSDLELGFITENLGRGPQGLGHVLGLQTVELAMALKDGKLEPKGLSGAVAESARLGGAQLPASLLALVPEDTSVVVAASLSLPTKIEAETLKTFLEAPSGDTKERQVVLLWNPRGDPRQPLEVALLWSDASDETSLKAIFPGVAQQGQVCQHWALASSGELFARLGKACKQEIPSLGHATPSVAAGWREKLSVGIGVNVGGLGKTLLLDAWNAEAKKGATLPPEMQEAVRQLEALPFMGWRGLVEGEALVPGGFRS